MESQAEMVVRVRLPDSGFRPDIEVSAAKSALDIRVGRSGAAPLTIPLPLATGDCNLVISVRDGVLEVKVPVADEPQLN